MNLKHLTDESLIKDLKSIVTHERELLTKVLYHLKELDSRKLYSSLGYKSLYDYACTELKYSADQAYRRIQAMRLLKEIPELAQKIDSGALSLSNISQAQRFFNETKALNTTYSNTRKVEVLKSLEHKSVREAQKQILKLSPEKPLPLETKKQVTPTQIQVQFLMSESLEQKLEEVRSLMGPKGATCSLAELVSMMADLSLEQLKAKKFGQKRMNEISRISETNNSKTSDIDQINETINSNFSDIKKVSLKKLSKESFSTLNSKILDVNKMDHKTLSKNLDVKKVQAEMKSDQSKINTSRYISAKVKHFVWYKNHGECVKCKSKRNLNFDHMKPLALGGNSDPENLRLLCFPCNQRQRIEARL